MRTAPTLASVDQRRPGHHGGTERHNAQSATVIVVIMARTHDVENCQNEKYNSPRYHEVKHRDAHEAKNCLTHDGEDCRQRKSSNHRKRDDAAALSSLALTRHADENGQNADRVSRDKNGDKRHDNRA